MVLDGVDTTCLDRPVKIHVGRILAKPGPLVFGSLLC